MRPVTITLRLLACLGLIKLIISGFLLFLSGTSAPGISTATAALEETTRLNQTLEGQGEPDSGCAPQLLDILKARVRELDARKAELDKKEADLKLLKTDIEEKLNELKALQQRLEGPLKKARAEQKARFQHLVGVYGSMDPARAAALLDKMSEETVAHLFAAMKSKKVAKILALMDPDKAAKISSLLSNKGM